MPIYFAWFTTALLSVGGDASDQNLPQSGRLLYCVISGFLNSNPTGTKEPTTPAYPSEMRSDIVALMDPEQSEPVRVSRGVRNLLAVVGVLLLVPSLAVVAWAVLNHAEPRGLITIVPGGLLLGLILIVFAIRAGK